MFPNINPKQMQSMMKQMGISQTSINANRVIFETNEGNLIIDNPDVLKIKMNGQETYQITGHAELQETDNELKDEDIEMVISQTGKDREIVIQTLKDSDGDIAEAIMKLKE
jgi:nascent polypeptide-associated complex subunit alpha